MVAAARVYKTEHGMARMASEFTPILYDYGSQQNYTYEDTALHMRTGAGNDDMVPVVSYDHFGTHGFRGRGGGGGGRGGRGGGGDDDHTLNTNAKIHREIVKKWYTENTAEKLGNMKDMKDWDLVELNNAPTTLDQNTYAQQTTKCLENIKKIQSVLSKDKNSIFHTAKWPHNSTRKDPVTGVASKINGPEKNLHGHIEDILTQTYPPAVKTARTAYIDETKKHSLEMYRKCKSICKLLDTSVNSVIHSGEFDVKNVGFMTHMLMAFYHLQFSSVYNYQKYVSGHEQNYNTFMSRNHPKIVADTVRRWMAKKHRIFRHRSDFTTDMETRKIVWAIVTNDCSLM